MEKIIKVKNLYKSYGKIQAVQGLDFYVETGKLFAFLGPNGAGKSTTIDMICTLLQADSGSITVAQWEVGTHDQQIRQMIGAVFQEGVLDNLLTVEENLQTRGSFYGLHGKELHQAVQKTANLTGVTELLKRPYGKLSGGQKRRCDIARALIHTPKILFLDEPTTGLDPQTRQAVWETIQDIQKQNQMTIFMTTHYMEEAARADYVVIIDEGHITAKGTPAELKEHYSKDKLILATKNVNAVAAVLQQFQLTYHQIADTFEVNIQSTLDAVPVITACLTELESFEVIKGTMDDVFIMITGKEMRS
ncbi:MAG: ATP-binding cassette domain-containing protein [Culicoidibacterales bacterium]